jgi:hypothetical protein
MFNIFKKVILIFLRAVQTRIGENKARSRFFGQLIGSRNDKVINIDGIDK